MLEVSVILPNYNHSNFLDKRLQSILNQTYQNFELIILDDCSTDNSKEIIEKYRSHERVSYIEYNEVNGGTPFKQWDKGISKAKGTFIWIAESDDYCEPNFLAELIPPMKNDADLVLAFCQSLFVSPDERIVGRSEAENLSKKMGGRDFLRRYLLGSNSIDNVSMAVFRKDVISSISSEYKNFKYCGDWLLYANICLKGSVFISGKYLNYYLRHNKSVSTSSSKMGYDFLEGNKIFHFIKNNVQVEDNDILKALNQRINRYIELKDEFHGNLKKDVMKSILDLDPSMRRLMQKRMSIRTIQKALLAIKDSVFSF